MSYDHQQTMSPPVSVAVAQTDSVVVAAGTTRQHVHVLAALIDFGAAGPASVVFNSKGAGAGTAISATISGAANKTAVLPDGNWFQTNAGEALTVTTGAGTNVVSLQVIYQYVSF